MTVFILSTALPLLAFIYLTCTLLYATKHVDALGWIVWAAYFGILPIAAILALFALHEPAPVFVKRAVIAALCILILQIIKPFVHYLPKCIRHPLNYFYALIFDFFALVTFFILYRSKCWRSTPRGSLGKGTIPVLLIHGYKHDAGAWVLHRPQLAEDGIGPIFDINLGSSIHSIEEYAYRVKIKAEHIAETTGNSDIILVGFSMGGIVAAYYALHMAPKETVKGVITLGSPLEGTKMAILGDGKCALELHYRSKFVTTLKAQISASSTVRFCHIGSYVDPTIRPPSSAWLVGGNSTKILIEDQGHLSMLYSDSVTRILSECIKKFC